MIRWLHFSDLHCGAPGTAGPWPNLAQLLAEDIERLSEGLGPIDLVFFTGDLVFSGKAEEFDLAEERLAGLLEAIKRAGGSPLFFAVPGNHDLCRPAKAAPGMDRLRAWAKGGPIDEAFWHDPNTPERFLISEAFEGYSNWVARSGLPFPKELRRGILPGDFGASVKIGDLDIGIVGLNSAFLHLEDGNQRGKLALGLNQLEASCGPDFPAWCAERDACFLLTHHPPAWLGKAALGTFEEELAPTGRFDAHFFGHMHGNELASSYKGGRGQRLRAQAASLFGMKESSGRGSRLHGYSGGRLSLGEGGTASFRLWPRTGRLLEGQGWNIIPDSANFDLDWNDRGTVELVVTRLA